MSFNLL